MPTIKQLPAATAIGANDLLPVSQNGLTRSTTVSTLLSNTQPLLSLAQGTLLGRVSAGLGGAESVSIGIGLAQQADVVVANGADHVGFPVAASLLSDDEVIVNSSASPKRLPAIQLRSLFRAGPGVQIDGNGIISATSASSGGTGVAGPKGDTGLQGPIGQGFTFRGAWQPSVSYSPYDVVTNGGQTYVAVVSIPGMSTFVASSWALVAAQGAVGNTGSTGSAGATGATGPAGPTIAATASSLGAVKPGTGLSVTTDGTLSISNMNLSSIAQGGASIGQLLGWSGTSWAPTTPASGVSYTGAAPVSVSAGVIGLGQNNAVVGQVLTWNGSSWVPQAATGAVVGVATPLSDGTATAGTAAAASHEDHRHPTDTTRAPIINPVFIGAITLPTWTTTTRPAAPNQGMEGYATDTARRETYTPAGWVQYVRLSDLSAASSQLFGGSSVPGVAAAISVGAGLSLASGTLSATATATNQTISGVSIDGSTIVASSTVPYQMAAADRVVDVNKSSGAQTKILLPQNPTLWIDYTVIDGKGDAFTNNVILSPAQGGTINGLPNFVMNANNDAITLRAVSATTWRIS